MTSPLPEQVIADALHAAFDKNSRVGLSEDARDLAAALRAAGYLASPDEVSVPREALRIALDENHNGTPFSAYTARMRQLQARDVLLARLDSGEPA